MKRVLATGTLSLFIVGSALAAADLFKFTFEGVEYPDGKFGPIEASVRINPRSEITVCNYFASPNNQYLGQFQGADNSSTDAPLVLDYCLAHYDARTLPKK